MCLYQRLCVQGYVNLCPGKFPGEKSRMIRYDRNVRKTECLHPSNQGHHLWYNLLTGAKRGLLKCGSDLKEFVTMKANCGALSQVHLG